MILADFKWNSNQSLFEIGSLIVYIVLGVLL